MTTKRNDPRRPWPGNGSRRVYQAVRAFYSTAARPDAQRVKEAIEPAEFYAAELPTMKSTTRRGWVDGGLCPFHRDGHAGSFRVHTETGAFVCFACGTKGADLIAFVMARYGLEFPEALERLAEDWRVTA